MSSRRSVVKAGRVSCHRETKKQKGSPSEKNGVSKSFRELTKFLRQRFQLVFVEEQLFELLQLRDAGIHSGEVVATEV